jgi:thiosulfate/3-mercaptopyruvate sulfurtransferase
VDAFCDLLGSLGIDPDTEVVVYDDAGGSVAARLWWMLRSIGHERARVLDGGISAWQGAGKPLSRGTESRSPTRYPKPRDFEGAVGIDELGGRTLLDVRAPERYRGEVEPVDPKAGHIPGAINIPFTGNLGDDGQLLPADELRRRYQHVPEDAIVSCGSGVNACHSALAMVLAGRPMPDVYVGSFSEWSRRDLPVGVGSNP